MCRGLMGCVVILVNIIVLIISLGFVAIGAILLWSKPILQKIIDKLMKQLSEELGQQSQEVVDSMLEEIMKLSSPIGMALFILGIVLCVLTILAFVGVCCHLSCFLIIYAAVVGAIAVAHIVFLVVYFTKKDWVLNFLHKYLEQQVKGYVSLENGDSNSLLIGAVMVTMKCCGYNNGSDFKMPDAKFSGRDSVNGQQFPKIDYPLPCCAATDVQNAYKKYASGQNLPVGFNFTVPQDICPNVFTSTNSYIEIGCRKTVDQDFVKIADFAAYVSIGPLILEVLLCVMAILLVVLRKK